MFGDLIRTPFTIPIDKITDSDGDLCCNTPASLFAGRMTFNVTRAVVIVSAAREYR